MELIPHAISWNITKRCNLHCKHCYIDSVDSRSSDRNLMQSELTTGECFKVIDQISEVNPRLVLILTGGEPLLRKDIYDLIKYSRNKGITVFLGTNGCLFNNRIAERLMECGVSGCGISLDSLEPSVHDLFRGVRGAWKGAVKAAELCKEKGIAFQIQTTVTTNNITEIADIVRFSKSLGASAFQLFFLVCTGRGQGLTDINPGQYEETLIRLYEIQKKFQGSMLVGAKCAPHYKRIVYNLDPTSSLLKAYEGGCPAGTNYCRITSEGYVTACPYMDTIAGDLREKSFSEIWRDSVQFNELRGLDLKGRCGRCEFKSICKGCRARALASNKDQLSEDPWCLYESNLENNYEKRAVVKLREEGVFGMKADFSLKWTEEAKERLSKVPSFIRGMAIKAAERYARENGYKEVTPEIMKAARESMAKENKTIFPFGKMFKKKDNKKEDKVSDAGSVSNPEQDKDGSSALSKERLFYLKDGEIPWTESAKNRVENAPSFVRPGIYKLMQKRAKEEGETVITSDFLTRIRNESMLLAAGRMKKFGFDDLKMEVFEIAKDRIKNERKRMVIDEIKEFLDRRTKKNERIISLFEEYLKPNDK